MDNRDNRDIPPIEEERAGYRQIIAVLAVIIVAIVGLLLLFSYLNNPRSSAVITRETTIQTVPGTENQPPSTKETTVIREQITKPATP